MKFFMAATVLLLVAGKATALALEIVPDSELIAVGHAVTFTAVVSNDGDEASEATAAQIYFLLDYASLDSMPVECTVQAPQGG